MPEILKKYKREDACSYTLGSFPTYELLRAAPERCEKILYAPSFTGADELCAAAGRQGIPCLEDGKSVERVSGKGNVYVVGVFRKEDGRKLTSRCHVVLVNPADMGNVGTVIRTAAGIGEADVALIAPCADLYDPKTVRASMGALFRIRTGVFESFEAYREAYPGRELYPFMLEGSGLLGEVPRPAGDFSLIFGSEAAGLPPSYRGIGRSVRIPMTEKVDSYNLAVSAAIGLYAFLA